MTEETEDPMTMPKSVRLLACGLLLAFCGRGQRRAWDGTEVVFVIESNPTNLDARYGQDAQSQRIAALIYSGLVERDAEMEEKRKELCSEEQKILANDVPYVPLWFKDVTSVHRREMGEIALSPAGGYEFL